MIAKKTQRVRRMMNSLRLLRALCVNNLFNKYVNAGSTNMVFLQPNKRGQ